MFSICRLEVTACFTFASDANHLSARSKDVIIGGCILTARLGKVYCAIAGIFWTQWRTHEFFSGGVQQIQLRTEDRENRDLEAVAP